MHSWLTDAGIDAAETIRPVPQQRIREKIDQYMSRRDYPAVERHLLYWLEEARMGHDLRGQLMIQNELVGHYRKTGEREKALASADEALKLLDALDFGRTVSAGTTCVNIATAFCAFGEHSRALELFERARAGYEQEDTDPRLLGGLYNNMALAYAALGRWREAQALYDHAMDAMAEVPGGALEQAITCLNRANALEAELGMETAEPRIFDLLDRASELLENSDAPRDGYYAFVCEKCAPSFEYYGYFLEVEHLREETRRIYERT